MKFRSLFAFGPRRGAGRLRRRHGQTLNVVAGDQNVVDYVNTTSAKFKR
jgi:hypothetical protein